MSKMYSIQLQGMDGVNIHDTGGFFFVVADGGTAQVTLTNKDGSSLAQPVSLSQGHLTFYVADSVNYVDIYGMAPGGEWFIGDKVGPSGPNEIMIDVQQKHQFMYLPLNFADVTVGSETDLGFDMPLYSTILPQGVGVNVVAIDATETLDIGVLSSETNGDADGIIDLISVGTLGVLLAKSAATNTRGALLGGTTLDFGHTFTGSNGRSISATLTAGSDTAEVMVMIPYLLAPQPA